MRVPTVRRAIAIPERCAGNGRPPPWCDFYTVGDSRHLAIASLDKPVSGVRIETSQGPVWTDFSGQAVIPSVSAWREAAVEINTATLPKNMDIGNGLRMLKQGRGAVGKIRFSTITERRVLLDVTLGNGDPLPKGVAVTDSAGNYLTTSVDDGVLF